MSRPTHRLCPVRRLVWTAIGAAGGIWAYRKGSEWVDQAREQGVALTVQQVALNATQTVHQISATLAERGPGRARPTNPGQPGGQTELSDPTQGGGTDGLR